MEQQQRSEGIDLPSLTCQVHVNKFVPGLPLICTSISSTLTTTVEKLSLHYTSLHAKPRFHDTKWTFQVRSYPVGRSFLPVPAIDTY